MNGLRIAILLALAGFGWITSAFAVENWPAWRGPRGDGTSLDPKVPVSFKLESDVIWKTPLPGKGHASPVIWEDRIFTVAAVEETEERLMPILRWHKDDRLLVRPLRVDRLINTRQKFIIRHRDALFAVGEHGNWLRNRDHRDLPIAPTLLLAADHSFEQVYAMQG